MDLIKIKVNLPKKVYDILEIDMEAFGFLKADGSVNKNGFINALIKNYFGLFSKREEEVINKIKDQTTIKDKDIPAIANIFFEERYKKEEHFTKDLQFIVQKENIDLYNEIIEIYLANRSISQYFREMIILYTSYPMDKRETILFQNLIEKINKAISGNRKAILYLTDGSKKTVDLYGISGTNEQIFNYVIGIETNGNRRLTFSYRLNKVKNIVIIPDVQIEISEEEKENMKEALDNLDIKLEEAEAANIDDIPWASNEDENLLVEESNDEDFNADDYVWAWYKDGTLFDYTNTKINTENNIIKSIYSTTKKQENIKRI